MTDAEREMLAVARAYGWHTVETRAEIAAAQALVRQGLGRLEPGGYGHSASFHPAAARPRKA